MERYVGEVRGPDDILLVREWHLLDEVLVDNAQILRFSELSAPPAVRLDAEQLHNPPDSFLVDMEFQSQPLVAVRGVLVKHLFNLIFKEPIFLGQLGFVIQAGKGDALLLSQRCFG